jgi:hypothetical protein
LVVHLHENQTMILTRKMPTSRRQKPCLLEASKSRFVPYFYISRGHASPTRLAQSKPRPVDDIFFPRGRCRVKHVSLSRRSEAGFLRRHHMYMNPVFTASLLRMIESSIRWPFGVERAWSGVFSPAADIFSKSDRSTIDRE